VWTYLVYDVDEGLGVIPREASDHLDLIVVREDGCYQRDALVGMEAIVDQPFPYRKGQVICGQSKKKSLRSVEL